MTLSTEVLVALITGTIGFITGIAAIVVGWFNVKDLREIIEAQRTRINDLEKDVNNLKAENGDLKTWAEALVCQVKDAGLKPVAFIRSKLKEGD